MLDKEEILIEAGNTNTINLLFLSKYHFPSYLNLQSGLIKLKREACELSYIRILASVRFLFSSLGWFARKLVGDIFPKLQCILLPVMAIVGMKVILHSNSTKEQKRRDYQHLNLISIPFTLYQSGI